MKLLIDTHALIWFAHNDGRLSIPARKALAEAENDLYFSVASLWEMAIKISIGKLAIRSKLEPTFRQCLEENHFNLLGVEYAHAAHVLTLPWRHRDPFDRLLVSQALLEGLALLSHDGQLDGYGVRRIW